MAVQSKRGDRPGRPRRFYLSPQARDNIAGFLFISPWLIHFLGLIAFAMIFSFGISLTKTDLLTGFTFVGFDNYVRMWNDPLFWKSFRVTAYYTFVLVPANVVVALAIAILMNQKVAFIGLWRVVYYLPSVVSGVAVALLWGYVLNPRFGLLNAGLAAIGIEGPRWLYSEEWAVPGFILMGLWGAGGAMILYLAGLQGIPTSLYEAAEIDGANSWHRFWNVTIPLLTPTIYFNVLISIIASFQVFTQAYILTSGGPNNATLTQVLYLYRKGFQDFQFGYASALAWALFLIILVFTVLVVRTSESWVYYEGELRK
ncbi:sugar ABC transporter permease [Litorilinea aerophila]|uniref:Sugar ABC transporter permease n=1 Tax=Litorilinea aerophila TaxID=1204385 RepID=A0A540VLY1_9CHLR|nr:sugar ABC transporter permease [Litorilinea aerophila]MCC9075225.1 sugar ABC transporter permease [Litorilinea aerophila]